MDDENFITNVWKVHNYSKVMSNLNLDSIHIRHGNDLKSCANYLYSSFFSKTFIL